MEGVLGVLTGLVSVVLIFGSIPAIFIARSYFRSRERIAMQTTIRAAIEKGQPLPPEMIEAISRDVRPAPSSARDLRAGIVWLGIAAGLVGVAYAFGYSADAADAFWPFIGFACIPGFIGIAYLIVAVFNRGKGNA
jgi:Domain of unknown function (DUF6249)